MEGVQINTSQNVNIDYNLAEIGSRIGARLLDGLFIGLYVGVIYTIFVIIVMNSDGGEFQRFISTGNGVFGILSVLVILLPVIFYSLWAPYFMQGQTFGKKILQIKIVRLDGGEATFGTYFVRWLLNIVDGMFSNLLGLIVMASNQKRQRVADLVAKTVVISTIQKIHVDQTMLLHIDENYQPRFSQVLQLSDRDIQIIRSSMERAAASKDYALVKKLRTKIEEVIQEYKPEMGNIEYVETVLKDYQYFSQQ